MTAPKGIPFTQYLSPEGRQVPQWIDRPADVEAKAAAVIAAGGRFEVEKLRTGVVSMEVVRDGDVETESVAMQLCANGPDVLAAVDKLVDEAHARLVGGKQP